MFQVEQMRLQTDNYVMNDVDCIKPRGQTELSNAITGLPVSPEMTSTLQF